MWGLLTGIEKTYVRFYLASCIFNVAYFFFKINQQKTIPLLDRSFGDGVAFFMIYCVLFVSHIFFLTLLSIKSSTNKMIGFKSSLGLFILYFICSLPIFLQKQAKQKWIIIVVTYTLVDNSTSPNTTSQPQKQPLHIVKLRNILNTQPTLQKILSYQKRIVQNLLKKKNVPIKQYK